MAAAGQYRTPGVYMKELSAFPPSVVGTETAVPAFIGYTRKADINNLKGVLNEPVKITSLAEFEEVFGDGCTVTFKLDPAPAGEPGDILIGNTELIVTPGATRFYLHGSMRLFYANGGRNCYVVSVGNYDKPPTDGAALLAGLEAIWNQVGPTMLVIPDATLLPQTEFNKVIQEMLTQCADLRDRVAILDIWGGNVALPEGSAAMNAKIAELLDGFRSAVSKKDQLSYGMAYYPWLVTSVVSASDVTYGNLTRPAGLKDALIQEATANYPDPAKVREKINKLDDDPKKYDRELDQDLTAALPVLKKLYGVMADKLNLLPPSGAMAGVYTDIDNTRGVWNAPANTVLSAVVGPSVKISSDMQEDLNVPIEGNAINAIRDFVGRGTVVWGARTLDGNSSDYRYIQVRRTLVYVEQSIKMALNQFVLAANDGQTWVTVTAMISNFLQGLWTQGGLMGAKASEAFSVQCGLGSTMTGQDMLNGYMRVQVTLQMIRPAEFIELTFTQKMQGVG